MFYSEPVDNKCFDLVNYAILAPAIHIFLRFFD